MTTLLVLVPPAPEPERAPPPPSARPISSAALALRDARGLRVVFGHQLPAPGVARGWTLHPTRDAWIAVEAMPIDAAYDRFPAYTRAEQHAALLDGLQGLPVSNPDALARLMRDKLALQRTLTDAGLDMPEVEHRPERFPEALERWGAAFLKPRFGALGRGVRRVTPGDALPHTALGPRGDEPCLLQRAVPPPEGFAAMALRVLTQRTIDGWLTRSIVARVSERDPVANVSRGARALPARDLCRPETLERARSLALSAATHLAERPRGEHLAEIGADFAVAPDGSPHLIELNGKPAGHLRALARLDPERFAAEHLQACAAPLVRLADLME